MKILLIVNSNIKSTSSIGLRSNLIRKYCIQKGYKVDILSRPIYISFIQKILNFINIYINKKFDSKSAGLIFFSNYLKIKLKSNSYQYDLIHIWENIHELKTLLEKKSRSIILDVPIAPMNYVREYIDNGGIFLNYHRDIDNSEQIMINSINNIIVPSTFVQHEVRKVTDQSKKHNIAIIPFGTDIYTDKVKRLDNSLVKLCFAGNISFRKGVHSILDLTKHKFPFSLEFHFYGRLYPEINEYITNNNINTKNIFFHGFKSNIKNHLEKHDIYIFPSLMEGSSKSIYEAMSVGLPVITTRESGSVIKDGVGGYIVNTNDINSLAKSVIKLVENKELYEKMSNHNIELIKKYTWESYTNNIIKYYNDIYSLLDTK